MKKFIIFMALFILLFSACSYEKDKSSAERYKLELQYYENSVKFIELNMTEQAYMSCNQTDILRSECLTTLVQNLMSGNIHIAREYCDEIKPEEKMKMTKKAFSLVYPEQDESLKKELREKLSPSKERRLTLSKIKEDCYKLAS